MPRKPKIVESRLLTLKCLFPHHLLLLASKLLLGELLLSGRVVGGRCARDGVFPLAQAHLDVAGGRHVGVNTTVRSVCSPTEAGGAVYLKTKVL